MTSTLTDRTVPAIPTHCPPWCTSHSSKSVDEMDGSCSHLRDVGGLGVEVWGVTTVTGDIREEASICTDAIDGLSPEEARQLAQDLMAAADVVDTSRQAAMRAAGATA